ncbi:MAG TPA: hypothetical protein VF426_11635 [Marmoricola sp.]
MDLRRWRRRWHPPTRAAILRWVACAVAAAVIGLPLTLIHTIEEVHFPDELGTFPVDVRLSHNGYSTIDTGLLGKIYLHRTGAFGFGVRAIATGPPEAGGTLASYVNPSFLKANAELIDNPDRVAAAYTAEVERRVRDGVLRDEILVAILGGTLIFQLISRRRLAGIPRTHVAIAATGLVVVGTAITSALAVQLLGSWPGSAAPTDHYPLAADSRLSFDNPQLQEVANQVQPFIAKNKTRTDDRADAYETKAGASFRAALAPATHRLAPRKGETIVIAEADPQGSFVGTHVRKQMYAELRAALGPDAISLRTIAGDITSNGTIAESKFVDAEAAASSPIPTAAAAGDHDSTSTWKQLADAGISNHDLTTTDVGGLRVAVANDREHKTLFGGSVRNPTGVGETELGQKLRASVDDSDPQEARITVVHQPYAAAGYLGLASIDQVRDLVMSGGHRTTPYDDGIPDQPAGILDYGHWHQPDGPWVLWNTDGAEVTWTVVDQLGTSGGVENQPTLSRFSTPVSAPLKPIMIRLQYLNTTSELETGYVTIECSTSAECTISKRTDVGLPGGMPESTASLGIRTSPSP